MGFDQVMQQRAEQGQISTAAGNTLNKIQKAKIEEDKARVRRVDKKPSILTVRGQEVSTDKSASAQPVDKKPSNPTMRVKESIGKSALVEPSKQAKASVAKSAKVDSKPPSSAAS